MKDKVLNSIAIIGFLVFVAMPLLAGCKAVHEPLQGLCYTDERGTYLCNVIDSIELEIKRKLEEDIKEHYIDPPKEIFDECLDETQGHFICQKIEKIA